MSVFYTVQHNTTSASHHHTHLDLEGDCHCKIQYIRPADVSARVCGCEGACVGGQRVYLVKTGLEDAGQPFTASYANNAYGQDKTVRQLQLQNYANSLAAQPPRALLQRWPR